MSTRALRPKTNTKPAQNARKPMKNKAAPESKNVPKNPVKASYDHLSEVDKRHLMNDLNSPSATVRVRAINACKAMANDGKQKKRYSMFDIPYQQQELVTAQDREAANAKPKTIQEVMKDVVAYVEVRSGPEDRSDSIKNIMKLLGATVCETINKKTTHVIFKGGRLSTYQKAKKMNVPLVPILWIEACKKHLCLADPSEFSIAEKEMYENPEKHKIPRYKMMKTNPGCDEQTSVTPQLALKPLVYHTPVSDALKKELQEMKDNLDRIMQAGEANEPEKLSNDKVIDLTKNTNRRKTIAAVELNQTKRIEEQSELNEKPTAVMDKTAWALAMKHIKEISAVSKENKTEEPVKTIDTTPVVKEKVQKRRTLFTPPVDTHAFIPPATVVKAGVKQDKRRSLYNPGIDFLSPPTVSTRVKVQKPQITPQTNPRKTMFSSAPTATKVRFSIKTDKTTSAVNKSGAVTKSTHGTSSSVTPKITTTQTQVKASLKMETTVSNTPTKAVNAKVQKRKLYDEGVKENTPPRPKLKQFLTPTVNQTTKMIKTVTFGTTVMTAVGGSTDILGTAPLAKRRRTLVPMTK